RGQSVSREGDMVINSVLHIFERAGLSVIFFLRSVGCIFSGRVRWKDVFKEIYEQGVETAIIVAMTSFATGAVLGLQGYVMLTQFGAREYVAHLVALSLVRELSPVFTSFIFSGKAGARMAAELGSMNVNDQILATRTLGVDPVEFLVVPRMIACFLVLPGLVVLSELFGIFGGYTIGVFDAGVPGASYIQQTLTAIRFVDFFSGFIKTLFFAVFIAWVCCFEGFYTKGGSLGVGRFTTRAVALSYIIVVISNTVLTKIILTFWG
ncbi:MAG TPA: ABC transporter permease, partial [Candidatus Omnitrophota bacterium]|nr:ABC transporter permease [Candidatus Omnitrophota bacterium]